MVASLLHQSIMKKGWGYNMQGDSDFGANFHLTQVSWWNQDTSSRFKFWKLQSSSDGNTWTDETMNCGGASTGTGVTIGTASNTTAVNTGSPVTPFTGYFRIMYDDGYHGDQYAGAGRLIISGLWFFTTSAHWVRFEGKPNHSFIKLTRWVAVNNLIKTTQETKRN